MAGFFFLLCALGVLLGLGLGLIQWAVVGVLLAAGVAAMLFHREGRPHELNSDVWDRDPEKRVRNLRLKTEAWRAGKPYTNPDELERMRAACEAAKTAPYSSPPSANPNPVRSGHWVRRHPMRAPVWEEYR